MVIIFVFELILKWLLLVLDRLYVSVFEGLLLVVKIFIIVVFMGRFLLMFILYGVLMNWGELF